MLDILIVEDHPMMSAALADLARRLAPQVTCASASSGADAIQQLTRHERDFDLIVLDLGLPDGDGFDFLVRLRSRAPATPIIVVSASSSPDAVRRARAAGALGFVGKSAPPDELLQALRQVLHGDPYMAGAHAAPLAVNSSSAATAHDGSSHLSLRQLDVLRLLCRGMSNKAIALELNLTEKTVKGHVTDIFRALGVVNRTQAVVRANERGLLSDC